MKIKLILFVITVLALFLRIYSLNQLPPSLNWDEVSLGYNTYSILKTGHDEWGSFLPLIFRAYGDFKLPGYIYFSLPFVAIFGLNHISIKLLSVISGTLLVLISYLILKKLTKSSIAGIIAALLVAFSPWSIFLSRISLEANFYLFLFSLSFYLLLIKRYPLSATVFALGLFTYNSSRVMLPFYLIILALLYFRQKGRPNLFKFLPLFLAIIVFLFQSLSSSGSARYQWVSLLDQGAINRLNELQQQYPRFLVNKVTYFAYAASQNYLSHFSPNFLFQNGGSQYQFNIPHFYLLYPLLLPFLLFGLFLLWHQRRHQQALLLTVFFFLTPLPSAITRDAPHTLRSLTFVFLATLIIALGLHQLKKIGLVITLIIASLSLLQFWPVYWQYSRDYSQSWQYGYRQAIEYAKSYYPEYQQILLTKKYGEPHEFLLFYWPWSPAKYQQDPSKNWNYHATWYWIDGFDKFKFFNDWETPKNLPSKTLLITSPGNYSPQNNAKLLKTVNFLDGQPAFDLVSYD